MSFTTGFVAKEVVVSTMNVLYHAADDESSQNLSKKLANPRYGITKASAFAFMIIVMIYIPCLAIVFAIAREIGTQRVVFAICLSGFCGMDCELWRVPFGAINHLTVHLF